MKKSSIGIVAITLALAACGQDKGQDAGVQAKPAAVIPGEHVFGVVGFQEAVAAAMPQDPGADRMLEALQELGCKGGGFVEAEGGSGLAEV